MAGMIAVGRTGTAGFLLAVFLVSAACASGRDGTMLLESRLEVAVSQAQSRKAQLERELWRLERQIEEDDRSLTEVRARAASSTTRLKEGLAALDDQVATVRAAEGDLVSAQISS